MLLLFIKVIATLIQGVWLRATGACAIKRGKFLEHKVVKRFFLDWRLSQRCDILVCFRLFCKCFHSCSGITFEKSHHHAQVLILLVRNSSSNFDQSVQPGYSSSLVSKSSTYLAGTAYQSSAAEIATFRDLEELEGKTAQSLYIERLNNNHTRARLMEHWRSQVRVTEGK